MFAGDTKDKVKLTPEQHLRKWAEFKNHSYCKVGPDQVSPPIGDRPPIIEGADSWDRVEKALNTLNLTAKGRVMLERFLIHLFWYGHEFGRTDEEKFTGFKVAIGGRIVHPTHNVRVRLARRCKRLAKVLNEEA